MILAQNATQALFLMILGMLCWGLWAGMYRLAGKWRYELFYFDVAIGIICTALVYALTVGSLGFDGFSLQDDLMHAGKRHWILAVAAGGIFNLANMILMGSVVVAGLSVGVALGLGSCLMIGVGFNLVLHNAANPLLVFTGTACLFIAIVMMAFAYHALVSARVDELVKQGKVKTTSSVPGYGKGMIVTAAAPSAAKGLLLGIVAGILMWLMLPLTNSARGGELGMGPYSLMTMFAAGMFASTFVFNMFFVNLPVEGEPVELAAYFQGGLRAHLCGIGAGAVLCTGLLALFVVQQGGPEGKALLPAAGMYALEQTAVLIAAIFGIFKLHDFRDATPRVRGLVWGFLLLFAAGLAAFGIAAKLTVGA